MPMLTVLFVDFTYIRASEQASTHTQLIMNKPAHKNWSQIESNNNNYISMHINTIEIHATLAFISDSEIHALVLAPSMQLLFVEMSVSRLLSVYALTDVVTSKRMDKVGVKSLRLLEDVTREGSVIS
ncbi:unnamed protein product [Ceratitis capitata]|uniref:(Mediterranean fruit fly) hypothetical protein n=1 Tax=Ceratitis capitata TaxID=7213 RepID=A0A811VAV8_CERCA|nr:unnamed protein product [Ceratitis capitata]